MKKRKTQSGQDLNERFNKVDKKFDKIDERFDKLENKIDGIITAMGGMATKDDLKKAVTNMATKDDIKNMATKDDIKNMATKDDLKKAVTNMATKDDLAKMVTKDHFDRVVDMLVTKVEFYDFKEYIAENMYTRADQDKLLGILDPMVLEFRNTEISNILTGKQLCDMDDKISSHDRRIRVLEQKI